MAEGWFLLVHAVSPAGRRHKPLHLAGAVLAVATAVALLLVQRRRCRDTRRVALRAWCPAAPFAAVNDAHVDTLGVLLTVAALGTAAEARRGALLGAAIAVKLLPVLTLPGALSGVLAPGVTSRARLRETASVLLTAVGVVALTYLPCLPASGSAVLGHLPGYLQEEGYESGSVDRFALLRLVLPDAWAGPAAVALVALSAWYVLRCGDPERPWDGSLLVTGTALLLTSPGYYWYALLVVALVAMVADGSGSPSPPRAPCSMSRTHCGGGRASRHLRTGWPPRRCSPAYSSGRGRVAAETRGGRVREGRRVGHMGPRGVIGGGV
ncbi:glycosyltransferase 87 family protein [Streptomyces sp. NPDC020792]|uniref:glycosyltransferase 87 family protein n=1 Tax=Streptomyces sp. NPDC020792 TaxID=3365089 RepID=UPI00378E8B91